MLDAMIGDIILDWLFVFVYCFEAIYWGCLSKEFLDWVEGIAEA